LKLKAVSMPRPRDTEIRRIGRQLRVLRETSGRTLAQIAEAADLSERAVRELEAGRTNPSLITVVSVADALGITLDELITSARRNVPAADFTAASSIDAAVTTLTRQLPNPRMRARLIQIDPKSGAAGDIPSTAVFGQVLGGKITVSLDGQDTTIVAGDSFHAQAGVLGGWRAGATGGRLLVVEAAPADERAEPRFTQQEPE
jgi:transcriptional regulator with XRE-family HTH domain